jgi:isopenicillin N synthase-like dioxygenase
MTPPPRSAIALLDLRRFDADREGFLAALRAAARDVGFFYSPVIGSSPTCCATTDDAYY